MGSVARRVLQPLAMTTQRTESLSSNSGFAKHLHLVLSIVADFMRRVPASVQREDLVAAGSVGLLHALRSKSHTCPEMFVAYARIRIRGAVIDELRRHDWSPRRRRVGQPAPAVMNGVGVASLARREPEVARVVVIGFDDLSPTHSLREEGLSPLEQVELKRSSLDVRSAVDKLPLRERAIVRMRYFDDVPSKSIASTLGLSEARVSQLLARAVVHLRELLAARPEELNVAA